MACVCVVTDRSRCSGSRNKMGSAVCDMTRANWTTASGQWLRVVFLQLLGQQLQMKMARLWSITNAQWTKTKPINASKRDEPLNLELLNKKKQKFRIDSSYSCENRPDSSSWVSWSTNPIFTSLFSQATASASGPIAWHMLTRHSALKISTRQLCTQPSYAHRNAA